ncbi:unnamed protein product [Effrenium voratum]|nr:unnamed protein product [Effrenium voratum]
MQEVGPRDAFRRYPKIAVCKSARVLARARMFGKWHCGDCGGFFRGRRGLQDHQRQAHGKAVEAALDAVDLSRLALMPYRARAAGLSGVASAASAASSSGLRATRALDEGLCAARDGDMKKIADMMAAGWDLESRDHHGSNALLWAAGGGHLALCCALVEAKLDPRSHQKDRRNALHWAARNGHVDVCCWLAQFLDPDTATLDGTTPLHWAVWQGHKDVCDFLIHEAKANLHAKNKYGCNASQWAALAGSVEMCLYLQRKGLDLAVLNFNGHSALHKAAVKGQRDLCQWLLGEGGLGQAQDSNSTSRKIPDISLACNFWSQFLAVSCPCFCFI